MRQLRGNFDLSEQNLNIGFLIGGGFGDFLFFANYLYYFREKFLGDDIRIDTFLGGGIKNIRAIFKENGICSRCYAHIPDVDYYSEYDLFFNLSRYPEVRHCNFKRVQEFLPELIPYIFLCKKFKLEHPRYFDTTVSMIEGSSARAACDGMSALLGEFQNQNRLQQPDIYGFLGIRQEYQYPLFIDKDEDALLNRLGLAGKRYITMHRGCDTQYPTHVKMWPLENYGALAAMLKSRYPDIVIVQYGVNRKRCPAMKHVDLDLVGQTDMEDVKVLLKHALLHVDSDGGMIHLRHALHGGPSVALYGPNYGNFFGYSENINLTGDGCSHFCDWLTDDWMVHCARGYAIPPCMTSITPDLVFQKISDFIDGSR